MRTAQVSVVVPARNAERLLPTLLGALTDQSLAPCEIILVDDASADATARVAGGHDAVDVVRLPVRRGSYGARNAGVRAAQGSVIAFCDADCTPGPDWLAAGVGAIEAGVDMVGGRVEFTFTSRPSGAEVVDATTNLQIAEGIRTRGVAKTANLFVRRSVFEAVGLFPDVLSGGDVAWTGAAVRAGHSLAYCHEAVVRHPTRRLVALLRKQVRVGSGQAATMRVDGVARPTVLVSALRMLVPPRRSHVDRRSRDVRRTVARAARLRVYVAAWMARAATGVGRVVGAR